MIKIYLDPSAKAIFMEDANGGQFLNSLQAVNGSPNVSIIDLAKEIFLVSDTVYSDFVDENEQPYGVNSTEVTNALNAIFQSAGTPTGNLPVITSSTAINVTEGDTINYELTATDGVGYEWGNLPTGLTTVEGNIRKLIGGSLLTAGVYVPTMTATNYNGSDTETLTITVANPPYSNTKSIRFNNNDYCNAVANTSNPLYRPSNGSGASDAWTILLWFKAGTSGDSEQTILMFGGSDQNNEGRVQLWYDGSNNDKHIRLRYGTNNNYLEFETPNNGIVQGVWNQIMVTYDGGTTGQSQAQLNDYYSRFDIFINGASQTLNKDHNNYGWSGSIKDEYFRLGRNGTSGNYLRNNCLIDEIAVFNSDQSANIVDIYNGGVTHDLALLATPPVIYIPIDGSVYPSLEDSIGGTDFEQINQTSGDIVNDVP